MSSCEGLEGYLHELPVVGSISGTYDLNVVKPCLTNFRISAHGARPEIPRGNKDSFSEMKMENRGK